MFQYPVLLKGSATEDCRNPIYKYFDGTYSLDEICCSFGQQSSQIEEIVERDPKLVMLSK